MMTLNLSPVPDLTRQKLLDMSTFVILLTNYRKRKTIPALHPAPPLQPHIVNPRPRPQSATHAPGQLPVKKDFDNPLNLETQVGDLLNPNDLAVAMQDVNTVFHVGAPLSVHEPHIAIGILAIKEAEKAGVKHFILFLCPTSNSIKIT
jgi:hypothetical protein